MKKMNKGSRVAIAGALLALAAVAIVALPAPEPGRPTSYTGSPPNPSQSPSLNQSPGGQGMAILAVPVSERPRAGQLDFVDAHGNPMSLNDFAGRVVLLNLWATWCPPCVAEMPALNALEQELGGDAFRVVAVSLDRGGAEVAARWLERAGLTALTVYAANPADHPGAALPTSVLIDAKGRVAWKGTGARDWEAPEAIEVVRRVIAE